MQNIAGENNLSETAFIVRDLNQISFQTKSGELTVRKKDRQYELNLPLFL